MHFTWNAGDTAVHFRKFEASEQAIPEGKNGSKVLAGYLVGVVVHSVNARRNENGLEKPKVYFRIGMVEHREGDVESGAKGRGVGVDKRLGEAGQRGVVGMQGGLD